MTQRFRKLFLPTSTSWRARSSRLVALLAVMLIGWYGSGLYSSLSKVVNNASPLQIVKALAPAELQTLNGRTNILLAGYSADDPGHGGANLTDSIMLLSIRQSDKSAVMISIPRDLYVSIPGHGDSKINAAYEYGEADGFNVTGYAPGGMGLLEQTVEQVTGVRPQYYALINYTAFKDAVDAVGGVTLAVQSSDPRGVYDPNTNLKLSNGTVQLDGQTALNLARSRGEGYGSYGFSEGDFTRTAYQQQLLAALQQKLASPGVSLNPYTISKLASALGNNVKTDLQLSEVLAVYSAAKGVGESHITHYTLSASGSTPLLSYYTTPDYQSTLIPAEGIGIYDALQASIAQTLRAATN